MKGALVACALFAAAVAGPVCEAQASYRIAGVVVYADSGEPLPHAHVYLLPTGSNRVVANMVAGDDGRFQFDMPRGSYNLWAGARSVPQTYGLRTPEDRVGSSIITGPDQDTSHLTLRWFARSAISGKVVDSDGDPVENALVQLIRSGVVGGRRVNTTLGWAHTNDLGEYRFYALAGGAYYLAVTGEPWYERTMGFVMPGAEARSQAAFAPAYYPNTSDISHAAPLKLKPGDEARADFTLSTAPGATVFVSHNAPPEMRGTIGLVREGIAGSDSFQAQESFSGSRKTYQLSGVPPGRYTLKIAPAADGPQLDCEQSVSVSGSDLKIDALLRPGPQVSGTVEFPEPGGRPRGTVVATLSRTDAPGSSSATVKADGSFTFSRVPAGQYRPVVTLSGAGGYFAREIHVDGAPFRDGVVDLADGLTVTIRMAASAELGRVKGFAMRDGKPAEGVMVVLAPAGETGKDNFYGFQTDSDGSYDWKYVRPGEYVLFAAADTQIEYRNPAAIKAYLAAGKTIKVEPRVVDTEDVAVVEGPGGN